MSTREQLNSYIQNWSGACASALMLRGAAILTSAALATTRRSRPDHQSVRLFPGAMISARTILLLALAAAVCLGLYFPLRRLNQRAGCSHGREFVFPQFQQRLVTFAERQENRRDPFIELLAADTLEVARNAEPEQLLPNKTLLISAGIGVASLAVLVWMIVAGPGYLGYGAALLWTGAARWRRAAL